jgi:hypothetical protein
MATSPIDLIYCRKRWKSISRLSPRTTIILMSFGALTSPGCSTDAQPISTPTPRTALTSPPPSPAPTDAQIAAMRKESDERQRKYLRHMTEEAKKAQGRKPSAVSAPQEEIVSEAEENRDRITIRLFWEDHAAELIQVGIERLQTGAEALEAPQSMQRLSSWAQGRRYAAGDYTGSRFVVYMQSGRIVSIRRPDSDVVLWREP